jgi:hypothetical protein
MEQRNVQIHVRHGHFKDGKASPTYNSWVMMRRRCNEKRSGYEKILYPREWDGFVNFLEDMGERPSNTTLDRIDNKKSYSKANCRWATRRVQNQNRKSAILYKGVCLKEWSRRIGIPYMTLYSRIVRDGWSFERAIRAI